VLDNFATAPISEAEKFLFEFLEKVNHHSAAIAPADVERVRHAGWSDEAIYDAITVCALFNFYNRWVDAAGVHDMSPEDYRASGKRLAARGYTEPRP
jgi:alkylhydroperoxidase family enzyme